MQEHAQYAAAAAVPLIKSPSLRVPKPVGLIEMPVDIQPLPASIQEYFAYPFTLEPHVITMESSRQITITAHAARRATYLQDRDDQKERRQREALRRVAPGFEPNSGPLIPKRIVGPGSKRLDDLTASTIQPTPPSVAKPPRGVMDDLVDQLEAMEARRPT